jgi:hypothetical protein
MVVLAAGDGVPWLGLAGVGIVFQRPGSRTIRFRCLSQGDLEGLSQALGV